MGLATRSASVELQKICSRFFTFERLKELDHGMDTNMNESMNNTIACIAPKTRVFCGTCSLQNRVAIAVGVVSLCPKAYFTRLLTKLSIEIAPPFAHYLNVQEGSRRRRLDKAKTFDRKRKRNESKMAKLRVMENEQKIARAKREGTYNPGGNILGFDDDDNNNKEDGKPPEKKTKRQMSVAPAE